MKQFLIMEKIISAELERYLVGRLIYVDGMRDVILKEDIPKIAETLTKKLNQGQTLPIDSVMLWVAIAKDNLPPLHKHVILFNISNDDHRIIFIHTGTSIDIYRHWSHYAEITPPCT